LINVHLSGDIVRCPDISAIKKRLQEVKDRHRICQYGYMEDTCQAWQQSQLNWQQTIKNMNCGRCLLAGCDLCPGHLKVKERGTIKKSYKIDSTVYRKMRSSAHYLIKESKKTLFILLTFPKFKRKVKANELNQYFSKFMENLRKNYDCGGYVAARERGDKNGRFHYHLVISIPFVPFTELNNTWCHTISDICYASPNALTHNPKTLFIKNPVKALRYLCKYLSKCKGQNSDSRIVFISNNIIQPPKKYYEPLDTILKGYKSIFIQQTSDYTTSFRITDAKEFMRFCNNFLYPFFELSSDNKTDLYSFPEDSS